MFNWIKSLFKKSEEPKIQNIEVRLIAPEFSEAEKEFMDRFLKSDRFEKMRQYLLCQLMDTLMHNDIDTSFKNGWIECLKAMKSLPVNPAEEDIDDGSQDEYLDTLEE